MPRLSVQLLTHNDEARVATALQSVTWADEVVVVDCFSTDDTVAICQQFPNVRVVQHAWEGFGPQRRFALTQTDAEWILILDSDEQVTPELRAEIQQVLAADPPEAGFAIPRQDYIHNQIAECPPGTVMALFRRDRITIAGMGPHLSRTVDGPVGRLRHVIAHDNFRSLRYCLDKQTGYAFAGGEQMAAAGKPFSRREAIKHTLAAFLRKYFLKQGFRLGARGFITAGISAYYTFAKYARLWEVQQGGTPTAPPLAPVAMPPAIPSEPPPPQPSPPTSPWPACDWKCAVILLFAVAVLTFLHYHAGILGLEYRYRLFGWHILNFILLFLAPVLIIKLIFRESLRDYGLTLGDWRTWGKWLLLFLAVFIPCAIIASRLPEFARFYPRYKPMLTNHWLIFASVGGWLVYFCAWEFFYRGFMLFGLGKRIGALAIFVQMIPFVMTHYPKPELESWSAIIAGMALGLMAWRSKSFVGPWLLHWLAATAMDLFVVFWPIAHFIR